MFSNTFNRNRKDPLVESIKSIMEDTELRNRAEGLVCEAFGVFNKNALANEQVADFTAACEDAYAQLKEGVQIDELKKPTPETAKKVVDRSENSDEWSAKAHNRLYDRYKKGYEKPEAKKEVKEEMSPKDKSLAALGTPKNKITKKDVLIGRGVLPKEKMEEEQIAEVSKKTAIHAYRERESQHRGEYNQGWGSEGQNPNDDYGERSGKKASKTLSRIGKKFGSKTAAQAKRGAEVDSSGRGHGGRTDYLSAKKDVYSKFSRPNTKKGTKERKEYMSMNKGRFTKEESIFEEIYINLNEKAIYALENDYFEDFVANLTEEEFDFLDEEIVDIINELVVQKSQMKAGETLGQAMNRLSGKTAIKGGANDPTSSNFKSASSGKTPATNTPGTQGVAVGKSFDAIDKATNAAADKAATASVKQAVAGTDYAKPSKPAPGWKDQGAAERSSSMASQASTVKAAGDTPSPNTGTKDVPTPPSRPASIDAGKGAAGVATGASSSGMQNPDQNITKAKPAVTGSVSTMKESVERKGFVTVGNMRIKLL